MGLNVKRIFKGIRNVSRFPEVIRCARHTKDWPAISAAYLGFRSLSYPREWRTPDGDVMTLRDFHNLTTAWIIFNRLEYHVDPSCRSIIDAGANVGTFTLYAARRAPDSKILAVEPFPETRAQCVEHIEKNGLADRVVIRPWALGKADGRGFMNEDDGTPSSSRGVIETNSATGRVVETVSLETLLERENLKHVDLLKIDIEGSEHDVFLSASDETLRKIDRIAMEYHPNASKSILFDRLIRGGFRVDKDVSDHPDGGVAHFSRVK